MNKTKGVLRDFKKILSHPEKLAGWSTLLLTVLTGIYVYETHSIVGQQQKQVAMLQEQFEIVNRPKIAFAGHRGDVRSGIVQLRNSGNLRTGKLSAAVQIVRHVDEKVVARFPETVTPYNIPNLEADQVISIPYATDMQLGDQLGILVLGWTYKDARGQVASYDAPMYWKVEKSGDGKLINAGWSQLGPTSAGETKLILDVGDNLIKALIQKNEEVK